MPHRVRAFTHFPDVHHGHVSATICVSRSHCGRDRLGLRLSLSVARLGLGEHPTSEQVRCCGPCGGTRYRHTPVRSREVALEISIEREEGHNLLNKLWQSTLHGHTGRRRARNVSRLKTSEWARSSETRESRKARGDARRAAAAQRIRLAGQNQRRGGRELTRPAKSSRVAVSAASASERGGVWPLASEVVPATNASRRMGSQPAPSPCCTPPARAEASRARSAWR